MSSCACEVVRITTGMILSTGSALISASTSRPSTRGRLRSSRISPGRGASAYSPVRRRNCSACSPSVTTCSTLRSLWCSNASLVIRTSPGSSSTSRTWTAWHSPWSVMGIPRPGGQGEAEAGAGRDRRVEPYAAAVVFDDLPAHGQADARSRVRRTVVQPLEDHENPVGVFGRDPDAVVAEREQPVLSFPACRHRDAGGLIPGELQRVAEQVLEHGSEQRGLAQHHRQVALL